MRNLKLTSHTVRKYKLLILDLDGTLVTLQCNWEKIKKLQKFNLEQEARAAELENIEQSQPIMHIINILKHFRGKKALFSMNYKDTVINVLKKFKLLKQFDMIISRDSVYNRKPHPEGLYTIISTLQIPKHQVIFIGDRKVDVLAGNQCGIKTILVKECIDERLSI